MTPKEKAINLIDKFYFYVGGFENKKQCALIAVDLIIETDPMINWESNDFYWIEVKQEIEKL